MAIDYFDCFYQFLPIDKTIIIIDYLMANKEEM